MARNKSVI